MRRASEILGKGGKVSARVEFTQKGHVAAYKPRAHTMRFPAGTLREITAGNDVWYQAEATRLGAHETTHAIRAKDYFLTFMADFMILQPIRLATNVVLGLDFETPEERRAHEVEAQVLREKFGLNLKPGDLARSRPKVKLFPKYHPARLARGIIDRIWPEK